jgi:antitoxin VapB
MGELLKIESDDAYALASQLAELTGESVSAAVTTAIRDRLARESERRARVDRVMALAAELRAHIDGPVSSQDHNLLYGDDGLPA